MEDVSPAFDSEQVPALCAWTERCRGSSGYAQALGGLCASALTLVEPRAIMEKGPATLLGDNQGRASQLCPAILPSPLEVQTHE